MTLGIIKRTTPNYSFRIPFFDAPNWGREIERNFDTIDAVLFAATGLTNIKGVWTNDTEYDAGDRVVDPFDGSVWQANVTHTSAAAGSFADDRAANPTYWTVLSVSLNNRGQWTTATAYNVNEFVYDDHRYGVTKTKYISGASYDADVAGGNIVTLIDLRDDYNDTQAASATAVAAAAAALVSENNAETAETNAELAETNAETAATNAGISETNAANSAAAANASQIAAFNSELNAAANGLVVSMFVFSTTVSYPPPAGQIRLNNATQNAATRIDVSHLNSGGIDVTQIFQLQVQAGTLILLQDRATPANYQIYTATGPAVVSGSDLQIPVVWKSGGASIANNRPMLFGVGGGGGAASVTTDDNPPAAPLRDGQLWFKSSTGVFYVYYDDGTSQQWVQISAAPQIQATNQRTRGHIDPGFNLANDTTDATNDIVFPSGVVASEVAPYPLMSHDQTIRQLDVTFDIDNTSRRGGRFSSAAISDGWWHCFIISNGTLVKSGFSKNLNPTGDDLYPAGYTHYRCVGSINRAAGVIRGFVQLEDRVLWNAAIQNRSSTAAIANGLVAVSAPIGRRTRPILNNVLSAQAASFASVNVGDGDFSTANANIQQVNASIDTIVVDQFFTNLNGEVRYNTTISSGTLAANILSTHGYYDTRGRI